MSFEEPTQDIEQRSGHAVAGGKRRLNATLSAFVTLAVIALIFVLQNRGDVRIHFLFFSRTSKVWATIGIALVVGAGLDRLFSLWWRRRKQSRRHVDGTRHSSVE